MRRRFQVSLYTEHDIEAELIDFLVSHDTRKRQELLRTLLKAGFSAMIKHKSSSAAMLDTLDSDTIALVMQSLMKANGMQNGYEMPGHPGQHQPNHHPSNQSGQNNSHQANEPSNFHHQAPAEQTRPSQPHTQHNDTNNAGRMNEKQKEPIKSEKEFTHSAHDSSMGNSDNKDEQKPADQVENVSDDGLLDEDPSIYTSENETETWGDDDLSDDLDDDIDDPLAQLMSKMN